MTGLRAGMAALMPTWPSYWAARLGRVIEDAKEASYNSDLTATADGVTFTFTDNGTVPPRRYRVRIEPIND